MPLTKENLTVASRIMLPTYVVVFAWLGLNYLLTSKTRLNKSPTLRYADMVVDIRALGILLLAAALIMLGALASRHRTAARYALLLAGTCFLILLGVFLAAMFRSEASPSAAAWPFLGAAACAASYRSVTIREAN